MTSLRPNYKALAEEEDAHRYNAVIQVARNIKDPEELLEMLAMLGLVDYSGNYIPAVHLPSASALVSKNKDISRSVWRRD